MNDSLEWLAGYLEGEGTFFCKTYKYEYRSELCQMWIHVETTDEDVLARAARAMGANLPRKRTRTNAQPQHKQMYCVTLRGQAAADLMMRLFPLMGTRRRQQIVSALEAYRNWKVGAA